MLLSAGARRRSLRLWPAAGVAAAPGDSGGRSHARDKGSLSRHNRGHLCLWGKPQRPRRIPEEGVGFWGDRGSTAKGSAQHLEWLLTRKFIKNKIPKIFLSIGQECRGEVPAQVRLDSEHQHRALPWQIIQRISLVFTSSLSPIAPSCYAQKIIIFASLRLPSSIAAWQGEEGGVGRDKRAHV